MAGRLAAAGRPHPSMGEEPPLDPERIFAVLDDHQVEHSCSPIAYRAPVRAR